MGCTYENGQPLTLGKSSDIDEGTEQGPDAGQLDRLMNRRTLLARQIVRAIQLTDLDGFWEIVILGIRRFPMRIPTRQGIQNLVRYHDLENVRHNTEPAGRPAQKHGAFHAGVTEPDPTRPGHKTNSSGDRFANSCSARQPISCDASLVDWSLDRMKGTDLDEMQ